MMSVSVKGFQRYNLDLYDDVKHRIGKGYLVLLEPAWFNPCHFMNDPRHLEEDSISQMAREANWRKSNIQFIQFTVPNSSSNLKRQKIMCVRSLRIIEREEKIFVDSGSPYQFVPAQ